ncbi:MAG: hypothetical protein ACI87O_001511 [Planctomycetota bacterium]|jgi:hypothetical protein
MDPVLDPKDQKDILLSSHVFFRRNGDVFRALRLAPLERLDSIPSFATKPA